MNLAADAKDYSAGSGPAGLAIMSILVLALFVLPLYLAAQPPQQLIRARPVLLAEAAGSAVLLLVITAFLRSNGAILKTPLKVYDEGILIQPGLSTTPRIVRFIDISRIDVWHGPGNRGGCSTLSIGGRLRSVEIFRDKETTKRFIDAISPALQAQGFIIRKEEDASTIRASFRRSNIIKLS